MAKSFHKSHSLNIVLPDAVYAQLVRFSELTGFTEREIVLCVLRDELTAFFAEHPEHLDVDFRSNPEF